MTRLPIWTTTVESYALVLRHPLVFLRLAMPALLIVVAAHVLLGLLVADDMAEIVRRMVEMAGQIQGVDGAPPSQQELERLGYELGHSAGSSIRAQVISLVVMLVTGAMVVVAWCRFAASGEVDARSWLRPRLGEREFEMIGALVMLAGALFLASGIAFLLSTLAVSAIGLAGMAVMVVLFTALFLAACRASLFLPQVACGGGLNPVTAWHRAQGQSLPLFAIYGLIGLPLMAVALLFQGVAAALLFHALRDVPPDRMIERLLELLLPWQAEPAVWAVWLIFGLGYLAINGLGVAVSCATLGLSHARLAPRTPVEAFD